MNCLRNFFEGPKVWTILIMDSAGISTLNSKSIIDDSMKQNNSNFVLNFNWPKLNINKMRKINPKVLLNQSIPIIDSDSDSDSKNIQKLQWNLKINWQSSSQNEITSVFTQKMIFTENFFITQISSRKRWRLFKFRIEIIYCLKILIYWMNN